jgi:uncharacterized membrane protein
MQPVDFFTASQKKAIEDAIRQAELNTSGEVRVHIERLCKGNVLDRATEVFALLKMHKTQQRNGVLFYLSIEDHQFAILGDAGINAMVPENFWDTIKSMMLEEFQQGNVSIGLIRGIRMTGDMLKKFYPYKRNEDVNELSDELSFGN